MFKLWLKILCVLTLIVTVLADNESICKEIKKLLITHGDENQSFGLCQEVENLSTGTKDIEVYIIIFVIFIIFIVTVNIMSNFFFSNLLCFY